MVYIKKIVKIKVVRVAPEDRDTGEKVQHLIEFGSECLSSLGSLNWKGPCGSWYVTSEF